jgi:hypothetical protein
MFSSSTLETLALVLFVLWLIGLSAAYTFGGLIHLLLAGAGVAAWARWLKEPEHREDA